MMSVVHHESYSCSSSSSSTTWSVEKYRHNQTAGRKALRAFLLDDIDARQLKQALAGTANSASSPLPKSTKSTTGSIKKVRFASPVVQQLVGPPPPQEDDDFGMTVIRKGRGWYQ
mmetsp:Transcript_18709/g.22438  ORF Transcript_18709/g.22438 Transcript_18709/m.22438 type:complete len:115 (+) Transcript_18709:61-405(+)